MRIGRRGFMAGAMATVAAPAVVRAQDGDLRFPHAFGETVLKAPARRVISAGYNTQDPLLAFGVTPLALRYWYGPFDDGIWPWAQGLATGPAPKVMQGELSIETAAGLAPDAIIGIGSGITQDEYDLLSRIAPVILPPPDDGVYGTPWDETTRIIGRAVGRAGQADTMISDVKARFAAMRDRHPDWQGRTAVPAWYNGGEVGAFVGQDLRAQFFHELGFVPTQGVRDLTGTSFFTTLSSEDLSPLEADLIVWISSDPAAKDIADLPMRRTLEAVQQGREVFSGDLLSGALSFGSILSIPWAMDRIESEIVAAIDGDPATPVPSSVDAGLTR